MGYPLATRTANYTTALSQQAQLGMGMPPSGKAVAGGSLAQVKGDTGHFAGVLTFALAS